MLAVVCVEERIWFIYFWNFKLMFLFPEMVAMCYFGPCQYTLLAVKCGLLSHSNFPIHLYESFAIICKLLQ